MQTTIKKTSDAKGKSKQKSSKDDTNTITKKSQEEKLKKSVNSVSTPRNFVQKSTTADIYVQKKKSVVQATKTPKKLVGATNKNSNISPMKDLLKSSPSTVSVSSKIKSSPLSKNDVKASGSVSTARKELSLTNVTVNSPVVKKKIVKDGRKSDSKEERTKTADPKEFRKISSNVNSKEADRQRSKTKTLNENEVKVLSIDAVDNNAEMQNLTRKLTAKPKAFFVDLDEQKKGPNYVHEIKRETKQAQDSKTSEDEVSYEDDFESYESDFDSYHESQSENLDSQTSEEQDVNDDDMNEDALNEAKVVTIDNDVRLEDRNVGDEVEKSSSNGKNNRSEVVVKDVKEDEKKLDSGNFELREARSANKPKAMDFILEDGEVDVKSSLTDEGFQEMSSSSVSSMKVIHTDVLDRPLFIDFTTSQKNKVKKKVLERLKQRGKDILSMVTLHEMTYSLFEMKPIPYDVYMATFGRTNYTQTSVQTFDDGITEEIQTDEIIFEEKWTQHPVEFSNSDIYLKPLLKPRKYSHSIEDYLSNFTFLINKESDVEVNNKINLDENYKTNPLRMYFEQKNGVGSCEMLPYENYEAKIKNKQFNIKRLGKFLKRVESRLCNILNANTGDVSSDLNKNSKCPFSNGYKTLSMNNITDEKIYFLKQTKVIGIILSETKSNLIFTVHSNCPNVLANKNVLCLWDVSVAIRNPLKVLIAINNVSIARFKGDTSGIFVAGLEDGSIHLWNLSEEPTWRIDVASAENPSELVEVKAELTQTEKDREWNSKNVHVGFCDTPFSQCLLQASSYTTSASVMQAKDPTSPIIAGLVLDTNSARCEDGSRKMLGQVYALQRIGIVTVWSIIQEKMQSSNDMGKAYWSKMKLEKNQTISLIEQLAITRSESLENIFETRFNFNAAKARLSMRRKEKNIKRQLSRQKSAARVDRPSSAASMKNCTVLPGNWETGIICTDLKIMRLNNSDNYLVAKNCGEVICCTKSVGVIKVNRFCVATDLSTVTKLEVSPYSPQHFIAATDTGTLNLCSLVQDRVLLTLDCRNGPPAQENEKYQVDAKGRFLGSAVQPQGVVATTQSIAGMSVKSIVWCSNPCWLLAKLSSGTLMGWDLTHSDIYAKSSVGHAASDVSAGENTLALLTPEGEVQVHSLSCTQGSQHLELFHKYTALL